MTPSRTGEAGKKPDSIDETVNLRRRITELQSSLSWRITAPLRFIAKPLFRGTPPPASTAPQLEVAPPAAEPPTPPAPLIEAKTDPISPPVNTTLEVVCQHWNVQPDFAHAALETFAGADYDRKITDLQQFRTRYGYLQIQLDYTFSTNERGRCLADQLRQWGVSLEGGGWPPKSYLDIGFAYGGSLATFANLGYAVTGIEISERLGRLGRLNLESAGCVVDARIGDFLSEGTLSGEGKFDLITCCDVIEHVMDPEAALRKICRLLKPGGVAYIAYPTKLSIPYVRADAHSQLFGLTLLDYFRARAAFTMYTAWPEYEVSDFYEPEWYLNTAKSAGTHAAIVYDNSLPAPDVPAEIASLYAAFSEWAKSGSAKLDPLMRREITLELAKYSARMFQEYGEHVADHSIDRFSRKWIDRLTRILIRKPSA